MPLFYNLAYSIIIKRFFRLFVANTVGDGNCLLHSASMAIWGIDDKFSIVRDLLYNFLQKGDVDSLKRRWRYTYMKSNSTVGLMYVFGFHFFSILILYLVSRRKNGRTSGK